MAELRNRKPATPVSTPKAAAAVPKVAMASTNLIASNNTAIHGTFMEQIEPALPWVLLALCAFTRFWRLDKPGGARARRRGSARGAAAARWQAHRRARVPRAPRERAVVCPSVAAK